MHVYSNVTTGAAKGSRDQIQDPFADAGMRSLIAIRFEESSIMND